MPDTLWFSPADYRLASSSLSFVNTPGTNGIEIAVTGTGANQWISLPLTMPAGAGLVRMELCYAVSNDRTSITKVRLSGAREPKKDILLFEDKKPRNSTDPVCLAFDLRTAGKPLPATPAVTLDLELKFGGADTVHLGGVRCEVVAGECCACIKAANEHILSEYYESSPPNLKESLTKGLEKIIAEKGGFLCIPRDADAAFAPRNFTGSEVTNAIRSDFDSVTVVDARRGVERRYVPPVGGNNSELTTFAGHIMERDLAVDLGWQGSYAVESLCSRLYGGGSSVSMRLLRQTDKDSNRFYVPSLMGIFPGQMLKIDLLDKPLFTVKHLGEDAKGQFFETHEPAPRDIPVEAPLYNKHNVHVLALSDTTNSDNQGQTLGINRRAYGMGDLFMITAMLEYQSNIYSGLGDEGGVGCAVELLHDIESFRGVVESWSTTAGGETEVVYKPTVKAPDTLYSQKLGTSRPLINLNREAKWKVDGMANVFRPGADPSGGGDPAKAWLPGLPTPKHGQGGILIRPDPPPPADWSKFIGFFIALVGRAAPIGDASEHYKKGEITPRGVVSAPVYRWWYVTDVQDAGSGRAYLYVDRPISRKHEVVKAGPLLFLDDNVTNSKDEIDKHTLKYILAPGAWVSDVRNGVVGNVLGSQSPQPEDSRRILLAPGKPNLAPDDPITNPPGSDVLHPTGFRVRQVHHYPGGQGAAFASENLGRVQVGSAFHVAGLLKLEDDNESIPHAIERLQKDKRTLYHAGVLVSAPVDTALKVQSYTKRGAIELFQQKESNQEIVWWNPNVDKGRSILYCSPDNGDYVFTAIRDGKFVPATLTGGNEGLSLTTVKGISATKTAARNLCGREPVTPVGVKTATVTLTEEIDVEYRVFIQCSWPTHSTVKRDKKTFTVTFSEGADMNATFDWLLVR